MKKSLLIVFSQLAFLYGQAQFFSGYYIAEPEALEFEHVKIHHHHVPHDKYHGDLTLTAYTKRMMLWEVPAKMIDGERARFLIKKFGQGKDIKTVYEVKIALDGIEEDFILMGYEGQKSHGEFLVVEEIFDSAKEEHLLELEKFTLIHSRRHRKG